MIVNKPRPSLSPEVCNIKRLRFGSSCRERTEEAWPGREEETKELVSWKPSEEGEAESNEYGEQVTLLNSFGKVMGPTEVSLEDME